LTSEKGAALNKKNIYIAKTSPPEVSKAYYSQFKRDFTLFLKSRAKEMVAGGRMVLTLQGSVKSDDPDSIFELLGSTLHTMVLEVTFNTILNPIIFERKRENRPVKQVKPNWLVLFSGVWVDEIFRSMSFNARPFWIQNVF